MGEETVIDELIKHWEEKIGIELSESEETVIKAIAYKAADETIEYFVTEKKEIKERSQRFKGLGIE